MTRQPCPIVVMAQHRPVVLRVRSPGPIIITGDVWRSQHGVVYGYMSVSNVTLEILVIVENMGCGVGFVSRAEDAVFVA